MSIRRTVRPAPAVLSIVSAYIARLLVRILLADLPINPAIKLIIGFLVFIVALIGTYWLLDRYTDL